MGDAGLEFGDSKTIPRTLLTERMVPDTNTHTGWARIRPALQVVGGVDVGALFTFPDDVSSVVIGRTSASGFRLNDPSVSRNHARLTVRYEGIIPHVTLEDLGSTNGTQLRSREVRGPVDLEDGDKVWIGDVELRFRLMDRDDVNFQAGMRREVEAAQKDPLTGLYTRRYLDDRLPGIIEAHRRNDVSLSLVLLDLDHFKSINDTHGHVRGDTVLFKVAEAMRSCIRGADVPLRYGGEEFALILPGASLYVASRVAERVRSRVAGLSFPGFTPTLACSISGGVATLRDEESVAEWFERADRALYRAKGNGRDRIEQED